MELVRSGHGRDLRVDFFRGLALWWIFVDHIPGNVMAIYSLHSVALCDAAEVFVLLAGFGAAKAYGGAMDRHGWLYGAADALRRAWVLYFAHIFLFVVYAAQVSNSVARLDRVTYLDESRLDVLARAPYRALLEALTLRYQPSLLNILPLYVALLAMFAVTLPLLRRPRLLLGLSIGLYLAARQWDLNLPAWHASGWYFDPFTWQLLFVIGAVLAYAPPRLPRPHLLFDAAGRGDAGSPGWCCTSSSGRIRRWWPGCRSRTPTRCCGWTRPASTRRGYSRSWRWCGSWCG